MRRDADPHNGHTTTRAAARAVTKIVSSPRVMLSTTSPLGIKDDAEKFRCMALIPFRKQRHATSKLHRE
jgi:hypothetical protein